MEDRKTKSGFPVENCHRCYGSGQHLYNTQDGSRCYGCNGSGLQIVKEARSAYALFLSDIEKARRPLVKDLKVGDQIARNNLWKQIVRLTKTDQEDGWSKENDVWVATSFRYEIELSDGEVLSRSSNSRMRRKANISASPYLAMIKPKKEKIKRGKQNEKAI